MKIHIVYIFSFLLLFISCTAEQHISYDGFSGNNECCTVRLRIPDNWKIVNAQLKANRLSLEYDKGRGIQKQSFNINPLMNFDGFTKFRGSSRIDRLAFLYFTKDENYKVNSTHLWGHLKLL